LKGNSGGVQKNVIGMHQKITFQKRDKWAPSGREIAEKRQNPEGGGTLNRQNRCGGGGKGKRGFKRGNMGGTKNSRNVSLPFKWAADG